MISRIYLDNNATTRIDPKVVRVVTTATRQFAANPSSTHEEGASTRKMVETCRIACADVLHVKPDELYFTSGATESNNIVIQGFINHAIANGHRPRVLCSPIEHVSVLNPLRYFHKTGKIELLECPVENEASGHPNGFIVPTKVEKLIVDHKIDFVSIVAVNHEIGTVQALKEIAKIARKHGAFMHSDYTQAIGKLPVFADLDAVSFSAHKFYGPKGVGGLVLRTRARHTVDQLSYGGDQEMKLRPGTENPVGILGMTEALQIACVRRELDLRHLDRLAKMLFSELTRASIAYTVNSSTPFAINITLLSPMTSDELLRRLSDKHICVSKGAACKSRTKQESYVLAAVGIKPSGPTIRIGIGRFNRRKDIAGLVTALQEILA
jgi:cysteine desulfurase